MFGIRQNFFQRSTRLPKKSQLLTMDVVYKAQPYVDVVSKNQNALGLDVVYQAQPLVAAYNNRLTGPIISVGGNHPDVQNWLDGILLNGGTASGTTISALNTFCAAIDNAGLRTKFYRLNLFCGNNLAACLMPLYTSPFTNYGTQYGYGYDLNTLKVAGSDDFSYSESLGLLGNTQNLTSNISRRYLDTGLILGSFNSLNNNIHFSVYSNNLTTGGYPMGVYEAASKGFEFKITPSEYYLGAFANSSLTFGNSSSPKSLPSNQKLYVSTYDNNILNFYEGRASKIGYRDITLYPISLPTINSVAIFAEGRNNVDPPRYALFNYLDRLQGYSIGESLTSSQIEAYYDAIYAFQSSLGRS